MSTTIEAVYEQGVLRLSRPIDLADGTRVDVIVIASHPALTPVMPDEPGPRKRTRAETMSDIAAMPMESSPDGFSGEDHDQVLYGGDSVLTAFPFDRHSASAGVLPPARKFRILAHTNPTRQRGL